MLDRHGVARAFAPAVVLAVLAVLAAIAPHEVDREYWGTIARGTIRHEQGHHQFVLLPEWPHDMPLVVVHYRGDWPADQACDGAMVAVRGRYRRFRLEAFDLVGAYGGSKYDGCARYHCVHPKPKSCEDNFSRFE